MFDRATAELIRSSPALEGLDRERLPEFLTSTFARIVAARLRLSSTEAEMPDTLSETLDEVTRLAMTNEALVSVAPNRVDRAAAAYVAATAYQLDARARLIVQEDAQETYLGPRSISPDISAMLLFLIAESTADANEVARQIRVSEKDRIQQALAIALKALAQGRLETIVRAELPDNTAVERSDDADTATAALYMAILMGVRLLAAEMLGDDLQGGGGAIRAFRDVQRLCVAGQDDAFAGWTGTPIGSFSGPFHLASLLVAVTGDLTQTAVVSTPPPDGIDPKKWRSSMRRFAKSRPYVWRNHREAINLGYLRLGVSAAVGFPTGAGKSTLAELKINATLLAGQKVVFLAPTLALVDQTAHGLRNTFPTSEVGKEKSDEYGFVSGEDALPEILVMTPEACLALMSFDSSAFEDVGLLVFDECHLIHPNDSQSDRRPIDAMLCVLNFSRLARGADMLLLSAMMKNTNDIAGWLEELTGRTCLSLSLAWKPTRQLRGSIVYQREEIAHLENYLAAEKKKSTIKGVPAAVKRNLGASPFAFLSLQQTWATQDSIDYSLVKLLDESPLVGVNNRWWLTPNSGEVSSAIAAAAAESQIKTLVFFQTIKNAASAAKRIAGRLGQKTVQLTDKEKDWLAAAVGELGGPDFLYFKTENGEIDVATAVHHGLLLPEERRLCESLYRRKDGIAVLTATSTLAQGMNLPSELVIIAEDSRFDEATNSREVLKAQELLNAAGRAGRAGENANGVVLVVPGRVIPIDLTDKKIGKHWATLRAIFGQSDQCLDITDPVTVVVDRIHDGIHETGDIDRYCVGRLASIETDDDAAEPVSRIGEAISISLAGYLARKRSDQDWLDSRIDAAAGFYERHVYEESSDTTIQHVAAVLGLPASVVSDMALSLRESSPNREAGVAEWSEWLFAWLDRYPDALERVLRIGNLESLFGAQFKRLATPVLRAKFALPVLQELTECWMAGKSLAEIELASGTPKNKLKTCDTARKFVLRIVPELAYFFGLPSVLLDMGKNDESESNTVPLAAVQLGRCVRFGFDQLEVLALSDLMRSVHPSRVQVHKYFQSVSTFLGPKQPSESWDEIVSRVETASGEELNSRSDAF